MHYENPLYLAEEAAALDLIADGRTALGWEPARPGVLPTGYDIDEAVAYYRTTRNKPGDLYESERVFFLIDTPRLPCTNCACSVPKPMST